MPQTFNEKSGKISEFITACKLFIRMKMRKAVTGIKQKRDYVRM